MPRLLLIEDNLMNRDMLSRRLRRRGYEVTLAVDGFEGLSLATGNPPDLILMDLSLPGIDGWELTRRLKGDPRTCSVPILALTAHAMGDDKEKALAAGCEDYDTKPVVFERLLEKMAVLLCPAQVGNGRKKEEEAI